MFQEYHKAYGQWAYHSHCKFCGTTLTQIYKSKRTGFGKVNPDYGFVEIKESGICGWWEAIDKYAYFHEPESGGYNAYEYIRRGLLRSYSVNEKTIPVDILRQYIDNKFDSIKHISPYALDKLVGDVFNSILTVRQNISVAQMMEALICYSYMVILK